MLRPGRWYQYNPLFSLPLTVVRLPITSVRLTDDGLKDSACFPNAPRMKLFDDAVALARASPQKTHSPVHEVGTAPSLSLSLPLVLTLAVRDNDKES